MNSTASPSQLSRRHVLAIAVLVSLGLLGAVAILRSERADSASEAHGHGEGAHEDKHDHNREPSAQHQDGVAGHKEDHKDDHDGGHDDHGDDHKGGHADHDADHDKDHALIAMSDAQAKAAGVQVAQAASAPIRSVVQLPGEIRLNEERTAHVVPRVAGVVESVGASQGQQVRRGQVLAVLSSASVAEQRSALQSAQKREQLARSAYEREKTLWEDKISPQQDLQQAEQAWREAEIQVNAARQKLQAIGASAGGDNGGLNRYELRAPFDGSVVEKHLTLGELVKEDANVFTVADLSTVWAEIDVTAKDIGLVRVGEKVMVRSTAQVDGADGCQEGRQEGRVDGRVAYVGALLGEQTRSAKARIVLANPKGAWRPGLFVSVELVTGEAPAAVTVSVEAVQQLEGQPTVFVKVPGGFRPQAVALGRSDGQRVEVLKGLAAGAPHASVGSFVVKSEAGKGSATHSH